MSHQTQIEHVNKTYYRWADGCGHAEPDRGSQEWGRWNAEHGPGGEGGDERICMLTPVGEFCEICTDENEGDEVACRVRPTASERRVAAAEAVCPCPCGHDDGGSCGTCAWVHVRVERS